MSWYRNPEKRRGMTGLETAIILVAFVISAAAEITQVIGDGDKLIEYGERWKVYVNYTSVVAALGTDKAYGTSYDIFRIEIRPAQGSVLSIRRTIPPINSDVMILE